MRRTLAAVAAAVLLAAACSSGGADSAAEPGLPGDDVAPDASPVPADETPVEGGTLRIGVARPATFDPALVAITSPSDLVVMDLLYDTLTTVSDVGRPVPALASFISDPTLQKWTFTLGGGTFAGGRPLVAADVKASLERVIARGGVSPASLRLEPIVGYDEFVAGTATDVVGIRVENDQAVVIETAEAFSALPSLLASPVYSIVAVETLTGAQANVDPTPLGSGSFVVTNPAADLLVLTPRDDAPVLVDTVELRLFDSSSAAYKAFQAGELDWVPVPPESVGDAASRAGTDGFVPFHGLLHLGFNTALPLFQQPGLREAIARSINGDAIAASVYGDSAVGLDQIVPPGIAGSADDPCAEKCSYDPAAARDFVKFIYPDGNTPTIHVDVENSERLVSLAELVVADLEATGIAAEVRPHEPDEYQVFAASGEQELFVFGWVALGTSAQSTLGPLFRADSLDNVTSFIVPDIDFLLGAARSEPDEAVREELLADIEHRIAAKVPVVPLAQFRSLSASADRVRDLEVGLAGTFDITKVWLADS